MTVCGECGAEFAQASGPGRRRERCERCSPRRAQPARKAPVFDLAAKRDDKPDGSSVVVPDLLAETHAELAKVERLGTSKAAAALRLAALVDKGGYTAQGAAALVKAHREALDLALDGTEATADVIDLIFAQES
jgi:uncharacterized Zn finger protein (UPF0148 family)